MVKNSIYFKFGQTIRKKKKQTMNFFFSYLLKNYLTSKIFAYSRLEFDVQFLFSLKLMFALKYKTKGKIFREILYLIFTDNKFIARLLFMFYDIKN